MKISSKEVVESLLVNFFCINLGMDRVHKC